METFSEIKINPSIAQAIQELGYVKPSPIQAETLPILLEGPTDFIGLAATGTGKTAAFGIPLLERINPKLRQVQALILCPTRELCQQVSQQINLLGKYLNVNALPIYGGAGYEDQMQGLKRGSQIVVGTPGRMIDHLDRGTLKLDAVQVVVLDEADEMISMGFREDMETILEQVTNEDRNIWLFSATMSSSVRGVAAEFLVDPKKVEVNRSEMLSSTVEQYYYLTQEKNKPEVLCKLIDAADNFYGIIFCQTKIMVADLTRYLANRNYKVDCLHGDMTQGAREQVMSRFRSKNLKILVCTDVAARGLDVKDVSHVVNYSLPRELDSYVHRIGRTARSGKTGTAMALVTPSHRYLLTKIERMTKSKIVEGVIPTRRELGMKKVAGILGNLVTQKFHTRAVEVMDAAWKEAIETMTKEEIAGRFLTMMFPEIFNEQRQDDMERTQRPRDDRAEGRPDRRSNYGSARPRFDRGDRGDRPERPKFSRDERPERPKFSRDERPERPVRQAHNPDEQGDLPFEPSETPKVVAAKAAAPKAVAAVSEESPKVAAREEKAERPKFVDLEEAFEAAPSVEAPKAPPRERKFDRPKYSSDAKFERTGRPKPKLGGAGGRAPFKRDDRGERPRFKRDDDRGERPAFKRSGPGGRPPFKRDDDRGERPAFKRSGPGGRPPFKRDDRGARPSFKRDDRGDRGERPRFQRDDERGDRPRASAERAGTGAYRTVREGGDERRASSSGFGGERRARPAFKRPAGGPMKKGGSYPPRRKSP